MLKQTRQDSFSDKSIDRFRGTILMVCTPLLVISFTLFFIPLCNGALISTQAADDDDIFLNRRTLLINPVTTGSNSYAVIFDAGSTGSRVHVFCFDHNLNLVPIGKELELFVAKRPGLSAYASDPQAAADSLQSLLDSAESVVPRELHSKTPVRVGATAGLRQLKGGAPDRILQAVRDFLKQKSDFKTDSVTVLEGSQEGAFLWVAVNYLLEKLGNKYSNTVGVVDLGGGSVQMAYAVSEKDAAKAPKLSNGDKYVKELFLKGTKYYVYVHSYLNYGLLAARAEILKVVKRFGNPCILAGYQGSYTYGGSVYEASASPSGSNMKRCRRVAFKTLQVNGSTCAYKSCTFGGIWNGGGGDGQKNLFVASFFYDRAAQVGFVNPNLPVAKVRPVDFDTAAKRACKLNLKDAKTTYPRVEDEDLPYLCMDLVYQFTLLVDGFGLDPLKEITLVKEVKYKNSLVGAAWPLGSAIELASSST